MQRSCRERSCKILWYNWRHIDADLWDSLKTSIVMASGQEISKGLSAEFAREERALVLIIRF